jgi:hypothetical protein
MFSFLRYIRCNVLFSFHPFFIFTDKNVHVTLINYPQMKLVKPLHCFLPVRYAILRSQVNRILLIFYPQLDKTMLCRILGRILCM